MSRDRSIIARVDQLDRAGAELDDPPGRRHRAVEAREMADAERPVGRDRLQFELDLVEEGEGALGADQQPRHVVPAVVQRVDVVAADPPQHLRKAPFDLFGLAPVQGAHAAHQLAIALRRGAVVKVAGYLAEPRRGAVGEERIDAADIVHHVAVTQGARAAAVVSGHAADRRAARGRRVDREEQLVLAQLPVEPVEHDPRLDPRPPPVDIDRDHPVEIFAAIDDQRARHGLPALRGAAAARQHRHPLLARNRNRRRDIRAALRHDHPPRLDLVDRRVGRIPPAAERVKQHLAADLAA